AGAGGARASDVCRRAGAKEETNGVDSASRAKTNGQLASARSTARIQATTCWAASAIAEAASESAARSGLAFRCTGPTRHESPWKPSPARQCRYDSKPANATALLA